MVRKEIRGQEAPRQEEQGIILGITKPAIRRLARRGSKKNIRSDL